MLSRIAESLFWIGRYMERAETGARLLSVGSRNALIPNTSGGFRNEWESVLSATGANLGFVQKYGDDVRQRNSGRRVLASYVVEAGMPTILEG